MGRRGFYQGIYTSQRNLILTSPVTLIRLDNAGRTERYELLHLFGRRENIDHSFLSNKYQQMAGHVDHT